MSNDPVTTAPPQTAELDLLMPLHFFLGAMSGFDVTFIPGEDMPEPYRHLLVHESDMTPRLSDFHQSEIGLRVHTKKEADDFVMRAVVLHKTDPQGELVPVEFGAISIQLEPFPASLREMIKAGERPLGGILQEQGVVHSSHPRAYFKILIDEKLGELLHAPAGSTHYGRSNVLRDADGIDFADIVEILPLAENP